MEAKEAYIDTLLNNKTYRNEYYNPTETSLNYFYKNNKFSIFNSTMFHYDESPILVLDSIFEIIGNSDEGFFVFTNPNTFFFIAANYHQIKGPHKIENLSNNRQPIYNIRIDNTIEKNYKFKISNYNETKEIIYKPNLNIVLSYTKVNNNENIKKAKRNMQINNSINKNKPIGLQVSLIVLTIYILLLLAKKYLILANI